MENVVLPNVALRNWLDCQTAGFPTLRDCWVSLLKAPVTITESTTLSQLLAARSTFPGFVPQRCLGWSPAVMDTVYASTSPVPLTFQADADTDEKVYGIFATSADESRLWFALRFDPEFDMPFPAKLRVALTVTFQTRFTL